MENVPQLDSSVISLSRLDYGLNHFFFFTFIQHNKMPFKFFVNYELLKSQRGTSPSMSSVGFTARSTPLL